MIPPFAAWDAGGMLPISCGVILQNDLLQKSSLHDLLQ